MGEEGRGGGGEIKWINCHILLCRFLNFSSLESRFRCRHLCLNTSNPFFYFKCPIHLDNMRIFFLHVLIAHFLLGYVKVSALVLNACPPPSPIRHLCSNTGVQRLISNLKFELISTYWFVFPILNSFRKVGYKQKCS